MTNILLLALFLSADWSRFAYSLKHRNCHTKGVIHGARKLVTAHEGGYSWRQKARHCTRRGSFMAPESSSLHTKGVIHGARKLVTATQDSVMMAAVLDTWQHM